MQETKLLSMKSVCMKLDCNKSKIFRLRREGAFPTAIKWRGQVRWLESEIDDYINSFERV